ncbi:hypothetical protein [Chryseobacterium oryctis]|uniref:Uncharacterized protein n=1 Tax=Chryseobacterium oryctis TaxID=2952618 RepID=A0ABT3HP05_9FLAO|nr:hypothetical protein [Chryseobacterium oryctis]MCW3161521.1 hypothetical protein [Chryseobacterium oryctis]
MAGGKITRIVGGTNSIECETWTVYTDNFTAYAGKGSHFTADGGTNIGEPKDPPPAGKYFVKGWWTDEKDNPIKEASIGDKVKFHLQMQNIPKNDEKRKVKMELRDFEEFSLLYYILGAKTGNFKGYNDISIKAHNEKGDVYSKEYWEIDSSNKIVIKLNLEGESLIKLMAQESDANLELYFRCSYINPDGYIEVLHFPEMESDYLKLNPPPLVEPIVFVEASKEHKLPAIYSADDGNPWYVNIQSPKAPLEQIAEEADGIVGDIEMIKNFFAEGGGDSFEPEEINKWSQRSYDIAVRKLSKGELVFNDGTKGTTSRLHRYTVSDIDGRYNEQVLMGVNRGKFKKGITSKGINQLEAQANRGVAKVFKTVGELNPLWDTICDVADILVAAANGERPPLPFTPPFVTDIVNRMKQEDDEFIIDNWNKELQTAIKSGIISLRKVVNSGINQKYILGFKLVEISEELLREILCKEYKEYDRSSADFESYLINESEGKKEASILIRSVEGLDDYSRPTVFHYIYAIYIQDLKI